MKRFWLLLPAVLVTAAFISCSGGGGGGSGGSASLAPSGLSAIAVSSSHIDLSWTDNSDNETGFKIERSLDSGATYTVHATVGVNTTSYADTGLSENVAYYYRVYAYNGAGSSGYSNTANATTPAGQNLSFNYSIIARGGRLTITFGGGGLTGASLVSVGGVEQTFVVNHDTQITVPAVTDTVPVGTASVVVSTASGTKTGTVTVIRLLINELDSDMPGTDAAEFIEISTGVPNVSLAGYVLVFWNGTGNVSYQAIGLNASTDGNGLLLVGNSGVLPSPAVVFSDNILQNGPDAVGVYQGTAIEFPAGTAVTSSGLIDALVYDTADPDATALLDTLLGTGPEAVQVDEGTLGTISIQRCADGRRDGRKFSLGTTPTPGAANVVQPCP